jgi:GNAT superfamily N-acetyltransferase
VVALLRPCACGDTSGYEFAKMGVREGARGRGVGRRLGEAALQHARAQGATRVDILSNRRLAPALALYRSLGFVERPLPANDYERADVYLALDLP